MKKSLFVLSMMMVGVCIQQASATPPSTSDVPTVTIDIHDSKPLDFKAVDKLVTAQNEHQIKSFAMANNQLVLSDNNVIPASQAQVQTDHIYEANRLTDMGLRINAGNIRVPHYTLLSNEMRRLPNISQEILYQMQQAQPFTSDVSLWLLLASFAGVLGACLLPSKRNTYSGVIKSSTYKNRLAGGPTALVGKGGMFDFSGGEGSAHPVTTSYLNLLWNIGKFSKENAADTYFYMAFYIPPQREYAASLSTKKTASKRKRPVVAS